MFRTRLLSNPLRHGIPVALLMAIVATTPAGAQELPLALVDVALEAGFQDRLGHGRALVAADFNLDGWVDFFVGNPGEPSVADDESLILWNNGPDGDGNITFTRGQVLVQGVLAFTATAVDVDNDGDQDLFIGRGGQEGIGLDYLFRNDDGFFTDVSEGSGLRGPWAPSGREIPVATSSGTWADYDNDGDLDMYASVRIHVFAWQLPDGMGWRDSLFRNNGDGSFTDVTVEAGLGSTNADMTAAWGDFDDDGWMDLFVPYFSPSGFFFYRNRGDGTFATVPISPSDVDYGIRASWSSSVADVNRDGLLDAIAFGRRGPGSNDSHAILINRGDWVFENALTSSGLADDPVPATMGTAIGDMNNDGYPELLMANGGPSFGEADRLYLNTMFRDGVLAFKDITEMFDYKAAFDPACVPPALPVREPRWADDVNMLPAHPDDPHAVDTSTESMEGIDPCDPPYPYRGHGSIFVDFDKDFDLDLAMVKGGTAIVRPDLWSGEPNRLYRNDGGDVAGNAIFVELNGDVSSRDALGARIEVVSSQGGESPRSLVRQVQGNTGFSSSGPREEHFGVGADDTIDIVRVDWPSGAVTEVSGVEVNSRVTVNETVDMKSDFNDGLLGDWTPLGGSWAAFQNELGQSGGGTAMAVNDAMSGTDYSLVGKLTYWDGAGRIGLLGRMSASRDTFYGALVRSGQAQLVKSVGGAVTVLATLPIADFARGKAYIVRLSMNGSALEMAVNRDAVSAVDGDIASGGAAVATNDTDASFDNIAVY